MNMVSVAGVMFATAALIIVLSVFNGFEQLIHSLYNSFQPALLVQPAQGRQLPLSAVPWDSLRALQGISYVEPVIEEGALLRYEKRQAIIKVKGVSNSYMQHSGIDTLMVQGYPLVQRGGSPFAVLGYGVAYKLQVQLNRTDEPLQLFLPKKGDDVGVQMQDAFRRVPLLATGFFSVRQDYDDSYVFVPLTILQAADTAAQYATSLELGLRFGASQSELQQAVERLLGKAYIVKNRLQQQAVMQKVMQSEKAMVFLVLGFILLLAVFNIIGSISMLIVDKTSDMATLSALGASKRLQLSVFAWEGVLISIAGGLLGLLLGAAIAYGQQHFGWIHLGEGNFIVDAYPVKLMWQDFVKVLAMLCVMSALAIIYPIRQLSRKL